MSSPQNIINESINESDVTTKHAKDDYVLVDEQKGNSPNSEPLIIPDTTLIPKSLLSQFCDRLARLQAMLKNLTTCSYSDELQGTFDGFLACTTESAVFSVSKKNIFTMFVKIPEKYESLTGEFMNHVITKSSTDFGLREICSGFEILHSKTQSKLAKPLTKRLYRIFLDFLELDFRTLVEFASVKTGKSSIISSDKHRFTALNMLLLAEKRYRSVNATCNARKLLHSNNMKIWEREALNLDQHNQLLKKRIEESKRTLEGLESKISSAQVELYRLERDISKTSYRRPPKFDPPTLGRALNNPLDCTISKKESSHDFKLEQSDSLKEDHVPKIQSGFTMLECFRKPESGIPKERRDTWKIRNNSNCSELKGNGSIKNGESCSNYSSVRPFDAKSLWFASHTLQVSDEYKALGTEIKNLAEDPRLEDRLKGLYRDIGSLCDRLTRELTENQKSSTGAELSSRIDRTMLLDLHSMIFDAEDLLHK